MIFIDSSAIIAYKNTDDINHKKAANIFQKFNAGEYGIGIISEFVLIEIMKASEVFERTWDIFTNQENTELSFVDASNLACMEKRGIRKIATFDKDFLRIKAVEVVNGL